MTWIKTTIYMIGAQSLFLVFAGKFPKPTDIRIDPLGTRRQRPRKPPSQTPTAQKTRRGRGRAVRRVGSVERLHGTLSPEASATLCEARGVRGQRDEGASDVPDKPGQVQPEELPPRGGGQPAGRRHDSPAGRRRSHRGGERQ